jgi:hypothetical protein
MYVYTPHTGEIWKGSAGTRAQRIQERNEIINNKLMYNKHVVLTYTHGFYINHLPHFIK